MPDINLLQTEKKSFLKMRQPSVHVGSGGGLMWGMAGLLVLEALVYGGLFFWTSRVNARMETVQTQIENANQEIASQKKDLDAAREIQVKLNSFAGLLDNHVHWTQVLKELGQFTLKDVKFEGVKIATEKNQFIVSGRANTYTGIGRILLGLSSSKNFTEVELSSTQPSTDSIGQIDFEILITANPALLVSEEGEEANLNNTNPNP